MEMLISYTNGFFIFVSFLFLLIFFLFEIKNIFCVFKKIPKSLLIINSLLVLWGFFLIPRNFSARHDFGAWFLSCTKSAATWLDPILNDRGGAFYFLNRVFSEIFDGIGYIFLANFNFLFFVASGLLLFLLVKKLSNNKTIAYFSSILYTLNPIVLTLALTDDYTTRAVFFTILSLTLISFSSNNNNFTILAAIAAGLLAINSRVEYIVLFPVIFSFFYIFYKGEKEKKIVFLIGFLLLSVPRILTSIYLFLEASTFDANIFGTTYEKSPTFFLQALTVINNSFQKTFLPNLTENIFTYINVYNLSFFISILAIIGLWLFLKNKEQKNAVLFFLCHFMFLFFLYSYLYQEGPRQPKYIPTVILPLTVLAGYGVEKIKKIHSLIPQVLLTALFLFISINLLLPVFLPERENLFNDWVFIINPLPIREYNEFKKLSYDNRIFRIMNPGQEPDVKTGDNIHFIANSARNPLYQMPLQEKIHIIRRGFNITKKLELLTTHKINPGDKIYAVQGMQGFVDPYIDHFDGADPKKFEKELKKIFELEETLVSFEIKDHHVFLYKMRKK